MNTIPFLALVMTLTAAGFAQTVGENSVVAPGAKLEKLAGDFSNATSLTADDAGRIYFTDAVSGKVLVWKEADKKADVLATITGLSSLSSR